MSDNLFENSEKNIKGNVDNCVECGKEFKFKKKDRDRGWGLFCSKKCAAIFRQKDKSKSTIRLYKMKKIGL